MLQTFILALLIQISLLNQLSMSFFFLKNSNNNIQEERKKSDPLSSIPLYKSYAKEKNGLECRRYGGRECVI